MNIQSRLLPPLAGLSGLAAFTVLGLCLVMSENMATAGRTGIMALAALAIPASLAVMLLALEQRNRLARREIECRRALTALDALPDAIVQFDGTGEPVYFNPAARNMLGLSRAADAPMTAWRLIDHETRGSMLDDLLLNARQTGSTRLPGAPRLIGRNGLEYEVDGHCAALRNARGETSGYLLQLRDVSEEREWQRQQPDLWDRDPVTTLPGRCFMESRVNRALRQRRTDDLPMTYIHIPVSGIQAVHAQAGTEAGNALLRHLTTLLRKHVRDTDLIARLDRETFAVLLNHCPPDVCQRIIDAMASSLRDFRFTWQDRDYPLRASLGLVQVPPFQGCLDDLLASAEAASQASA